VDSLEGLEKEGSKRRKVRYDFESGEGSTSLSGIVFSNEKGRLTLKLEFQCEAAAFSDRKGRQRAQLPNKGEMNDRKAQSRLN